MGKRTFFAHILATRIIFHAAGMLLVAAAAHAPTPPAPPNVPPTHGQPPPPLPPVSGMPWHLCLWPLWVMDVKRIPPNDPLVCFFGGGCRESVRWSWISFLGAWELNPGFLCLVSEIDVSKCKSHFSCTQCRLGAFNLGAYNKPKNVGPLQTDTKRFSQRIQRK